MIEAKKKEQNHVVINFSEYKAKKGLEPVNNFIESVIPSESDSQVRVVQPVGYPDVTEILDDLKNGHTVIINLKYVVPSQQQKLMDFICGACYALKGTITSISSDIFIVSTMDSIKMCKG